jgi:hypothetical protein
VLERLRPRVVLAAAASQTRGRVAIFCSSIHIFAS